MGVGPRSPNVGIERKGKDSPANAAKPVKIQVSQCSSQWKMDSLCNIFFPEIACEITYAELPFLFNSYIKGKAKRPCAFSHSSPLSATSENINDQRPWWPLPMRKCRAPGICPPPQPGSHEN